MTVVVLGSLSAAMVGIATKVREEQAKSDDDLMVKKQKAFRRLDLLFSEMDTDGNGSLSWQEWQHNRWHNPEFVRIMKLVDLDEHALEQIWFILDTDEIINYNYSFIT